MLGVGNVRAQLEVELAKGVKSSKMRFSKYLRSKRKGKESMVPVVRGAGELVT